MARAAEVPLLVRAVDIVEQVVPQAPACPASFDLGNGVTGTCSLLDGVDDWGGAYQYWSVPAVGLVTSGVTTLETRIQLRVPVCPQESVCGFHTGDATLQWSGGSLAWHAYGSAVLGAAGPLTNLALEIITDDGRGNWHASPDAFLLRRFESMGVTVRIDRASGTGAITQADTVVASIAVNGGCVSVDFVDPQKEDRNSCLW